MDRREISCCFTGHRPSRLPWGTRENDERCLALCEEIAMRLTGIYEAGFRHFICGMAIGCDSYFAEAVLALKALHPDVTLEAAVPCRDQAERWNKKQQARYEELLSLCDTVTVLQESYSPDCMMRRNRYMVDKSSLLLACFNGLPSGTMNTILYAQRQGVRTILVDIA